MNPELQISESASLIGIAEGDNATEPGTVLLHLMRPCLGKGRGRHIYEAGMLSREANSGHFDDWPMFVDHQSPAARKKAEGLPRSLRDVGGRILRTWWDGSVPAEGDFGQGAVIAEARPVPWVRELIEHDPKLASVSLNTFATGIRPTTYNGRPAGIVEGFEDSGSADWVTKPGAGGRVVQLLEAAMEDVEPDASDSELSDFSDDELSAHIRRHRPQVAEAITNQPGPGEEDEMDDAQVQEATLASLRSDDGKAVIREVVQEAAQEAVGTALREVLPQAIGAAAETIEQGARDAATHEVRMGRLTERANEKIAEAKLPEKFAAKAKRQFAHVDLDDKLDEESGEVTESAEEQLDALVEAHVTEAKDLIGSIRPTSVRSAGDGGSAEPGDVEESDYEGSFLRHELQEAGIDTRAAWGITTEPPEKPEPDKPTPDREAAAA